MTTLNIITLFVSILMLVITVELVRKKHLREQYSILWLFVFFLLILLSLSGRSIDQLAQWFGVGYPPSLFFLAGIFFLMLLILMISVIVSHQTDRVIKLTQKVALLEKKVKDLSTN